MSAPRVAGLASSRASDAELLRASRRATSLRSASSTTATRGTCGGGAASIDAVDAEDVVHTLFLKLPQIAPSYDGRANCRGWLCGIAVRLAMRHRRGAGRFRRMLRLVRAHGRRPHVARSRARGDGQARRSPRSSARSTP